MSTFALILPFFSAMTFSVSSSGLCTFSFYRVSLVLSNHVLFVVFGRIFLKIRHLYSHSIFFLKFLTVIVRDDFGLVCYLYSSSLSGAKGYPQAIRPSVLPPGEAHPHPALLGTYTTVLRVGGKRDHVVRHDSRPS